MRRNAALAIGLRERARAALAEMGPGFEIVESADVRDAFPLLESRRFSLILIDGELSATTPGVLDALRTIAPQVPKAILAAREHADTFASLADDPNFRMLSLDLSASEFNKEASRLLLPRSSERLAMEPSRYLLKAQLDGRVIEHELLDLSNRGLSFKVEPGGLLDGLIPGQDLVGLRIVDATGEEWFRCDRARIRHIHRDGGFIRVGLSFESGSAQSTSRLRVLADPLPVAALLRKVAKANVEVVASAPDSNETWSLGTPRIEFDPDLKLVFPHHGAGHRSHDVIRLSFDHHGLSYSGLTSVIGTSHSGTSDAGADLVLAVPRSLRVHHRRGSHRHQPRNDRTYVVRFSSSLTGIDRSFLVHDINASGLSATVDLEQELLPPGLVLNELELALPDGGTVVCRAIVRSLRALPRVEKGSSRTGAPAHCGVAFVDLSPEDRRRLGQSLVADGFPHLEAAQPGDSKHIWKFLEEAGFRFHLYNDGSERSERIALGTMENLLGPARNVGINILYRAADGHRGHIAGIRLYGRTWLATHLAAKQGDKSVGTDRISRALCMSLAEHIESQEHGEHVKFVWIKAQKWTNRMFGWSGRAVHRAGLSCMQEFGIFVRPNDTPSAPPSTEVEVRDATPDEIALLARTFGEREDPVRIVSEDLTAEKLTLSSLGREYAEGGLYRSRRIRVACIDRIPLAFALVEESTPAVQLSELLNAFELVDIHPDDQRLEEARLALANDAVSLYRERGLTHSVAVGPAKNGAALLESGFTLAGVARSWTFHKSQLRPWADVWDQLYLRGKELFSLGFED